jgi:hypothetical protein
MRRVRNRLARRQRQVRMGVVQIDRLLMGQENGIPAERWARIVGNLLRPSTLLSKSCHVKLLEEYLREGDTVFEPEHISQTAYYRNALESIDIVGRYFGAKSEDQIVQVARRFVDTFRGIDQTGCSRQYGQSSPDDPIRVRPIAHSDHYQIIDGHHRLAIAYVRGEQKALVQLEGEPVLTPLQSLLLDVLWLNGRRELYQPVDAPELRASWVLVRKCSDRLTKMSDFLKDQGLVSGTPATYLDIASSYGWFVSEMGKLGYDAYGVERDPIAASIGTVAYDLPLGRIFRSDCVRFLRQHQGKFDVISCFSLLHHFVMGNGSVPPEEFIRLVDQVTGKVLFLDTGQKHEKWYENSLPEWDANFIDDWLRKHTSFRRIHRLGIDEDAVPPFQENYARMLFACTR